MVRMEDIHCHLIDMPTTCRGRVFHNEDGSYSVFINARLSYEMQRKVFAHEVRHIMRGDLDYDRVTDVQKVELERHGLIHEDVRPVAELKPKKIRPKRRRRSRWARYNEQRNALNFGNVDMKIIEDQYLDPEYAR